jgi:hypothetical protein
MSKQILVPLTGELHPQACPDPDPGEPVMLFDIEIPVRFDLASPVEPGLFPRPEPVARVSLEDVDLGVTDWRELAGKDVSFPPDLDQSDAAIYLGGVHNPVRLHRIRFGQLLGRAIRVGIELEFDFRCVKPRPPELEPVLRVHWEIDLVVIEEDEDGDS